MHISISIKKKVFYVSQGVFCVHSYILYADGEVCLEMTEVFCKLIAMVIIGEQALEERQQLRETKQQDTEE